MSRDIEKYTEVYNAYCFEKIQVKYRRKKVLEILNKYAPAKILEIGCGNDSIFNYYKKFNFATIIEPSEIFFQKAKEAFSDSTNVVIYNDFLETISDKITADFDFIVLSGLLHEVENPKFLLENVKKLCSPNTVVHINVPNSKSFHLLWAHSAGLIKSLGVITPTAVKLQQNTTFDLDFLGEMITESGFKVIEKGSYFLKPFSHDKMQQCMDNKILDDALLDALYNMVEYTPKLGSEIFVNAVSI
jgi:2-polyprenyl-3-methyl-5-hydroxy-6-metoxy-1,4-benzoquinol methylase